METKRTPTPWRNSSAMGKTNIESLSGRFVAGTGGYSDNYSNMRYVEENEANAEFIVQACNAHDDLVGALVALLGSLATGKSHTRKDAVKLSRAALAKARREAYHE